MRGLRAAGSIRANSPKLKNHRLSRWIFISFFIAVHFFVDSGGGMAKTVKAVFLVFIPKDPAAELLFIRKIF